MVEKGQGRDSEDIKKECNVNCFDFLSFWWTSWVEKSQSTYKNRTKREKEETLAHRTRARSALIRERTLELRQWCTTSRECSVRLDKGRKSESSQTRPYGTYTTLLHWMLDKPQEPSSLIINYFLYIHISSVPVSNTRTHLAACPQQKSGIHFLKHRRCRPKSCHPMQLLFNLFVVPPVTKIMWSLMDVSCPYTFRAPLTLAATRSSSSPQSEISLPPAYLTRFILTAKFSTLQREAAYFSATPASAGKTSRRHKPEYLTLNAHLCENLRVYNKLILLESLHMHRNRKLDHTG